MIAVKTNQPKLFNALKQQFEQQQPLSQSQHVERSRNRVVERHVSVCQPGDGIEPQWAAVQRIIRVERSGTRAGKPFQETMFYISSLCLDADGFAQQIRQHWHIENRLHWVKDVVMKEDTTPVCDGYASINFAIVRTIALNLFRQQGLDSITQAIRQVTHDIPRLFSFFQ